MSVYRPEVASLSLSYIPTYDYDVYHDISGKFTNNEWCIVGMLWVPTPVKPLLVRELYDVRRRERYWGNIHYCDLSSRFDRDFEAKERVTYGWFNVYREKFLDSVHYSAYAIDRSSLLYNKERYRQSFQEANYWSFRTLLWSRQNFLPSEENSILRFVSHIESRPEMLKQRDGTQGDNFPEYLPRKCEGVKSSRIQLFEPLRVIPTPRKHTRGWVVPDVELMQLCDLLTGATRNAICAVSRVKTKKYFATEMAKLVLRSRASKQFAQHLKVWYFPDGTGKTYRDGPLSIFL